MAKMHGSYTAMITPMNGDGSVDFEGFARNVRFQLEQGIDGLLPLGTSGETPTLSEDEEDKLLDIVIPAVREWNKKQGRDVKVLAGAGSNNTKDAVRYVQRARDKGADYALVVTPYYNKPSDEGIFRHFEAVSKVGIPIIVYNIQGRTGKNISVPTLMRIADLPNIAGVKEASGSISQMMEVIEKVVSRHPDFSVMSGDDSLTLPLMAAGGDGIISVVTNLIPALMTELVHDCLKGDFAAARTIHYRLQPFFRAAFCDGNPSSIKYAMNYKAQTSGMEGISAGACRLPIVEARAEAQEIIRNAIKECGI